MCLLCIAGAAAEPVVPGAAGVGRKAHQAKFIVASFVRPVLFTLPTFGVIPAINVYSYGAMVAMALAVAFWLFGNELKRAKITVDEMHCFFIFLFGFGVGSKAHVAASAVGVGEPLTWKALDIRSGHSFLGSMIGSVGCLLLFVKWNKVPVLRFLDVLLPCCLLGHFFGKGGCFLSGDGCYGPPADPELVPWAMSFPNAADPTRVPVHPTPIYEGFCSLLVCVLTRALWPFPDETSEAPLPLAGRRTAFLLVLYGVERVIIEQFRRHPPIHIFGGLTEYQALAVGLLLIGLIIEGYVRSQAKAGSGTSQAKAAVGKKKGKKD